MAFLIFALFARLAQSQYILPQRCNSISMSCVGEGGTCSNQYNEEPAWGVGGYPDTWSTWKRCSDWTLICHGGKCMKRTQGNGEQCDVTQHLFCQAGTTCSGGNAGVCQISPAIVQPTSFAARGETCQSDSDCHAGFCDPFINKCTPDSDNGIDPTSGEVYCSQWSDCMWNEYCSPADTSTGTTIPATCKPEPNGFGSRGGSLCKVSSASGQCGWTQFCAAKNRDEANIGHTAFTLNTCQEPYSIAEGEMCPPDTSVRIGVNGISSSYGVSFCASGPCLNLAGGTEYRCTTADFTYSGTGCRTNDECGRGMVCGCPQGGGGRARCVLSSTFSNWERGRNDWFKKFKPWFSCLENNQCTLNDIQVGSCGHQHCGGNDQTKPITTCQTSLYNPDPRVSGYQGYHDTISEGVVSAPSLLFLTISTTITLLLAAFL